MAKPPKPEESIKDKFKKFLGIGGAHGIVPVGTFKPPTKQFILTADQVKEISPGSPHNNRISTIRHFCDVVLQRRLEENAVEVFWVSLKDLLQPSAPAEDRQLALHFLACLVKGQYEQLGIMRMQFFHVVRDHNVPEDLHQRLELFYVLSADGKDLSQFELEAGKFLLTWMSDVIRTPHMHSYMKLLINVIKFNIAYLDREVVTGLIAHTCVIATTTCSEEDIELCLDVLDKILCYYFLPPESLPQFIDCMCHVINIQKFCETSWNLMRNLLGTHLGHSGIYTMCCILQDKNNLNETGARLQRGAIFFIGMALWGSKKVASLKHPPSTVLPSFLQALENSESSLVAYEVALSLHRLVSKYGREQQMITWDLILSLLETLLNHLETCNTMGAELVSKVHDLLSAVEQLHGQKQFNGDTDRLFTIVETCASKRPETSILALISYKAQSIHPGKDGWLTNLNQLLEKYFIHEVRTKIRERVLEILSTTLNRNKYLYEDELIDNVVLMQLSHIEADSDLEVRKHAAKLLLDLVDSCRTPRCLDVIGVLHKIIKRMFSSGSASTSPIPQGQSQVHHAGKSHDQRTDDINVSVVGLVNIFKSKLYQLPSSHAQRIFEILVDHFEMHYSNELMLKTASHIRKSILDVLLDLRADSLYRLGLLEEGKSSFSPYILCAYRQELFDDTSASPADSPQMACGSPVEGVARITIISYAQAFRAIKTCLEKENDWQVLQLVLEKLPQVLQNKTLILSADVDDIDRFTARLCAMVNNATLKLPDKLVKKPPEMNKSEFHTYVFPVLTCLVSYHTHLDKSRQIELVRCLEFGLVSKVSARECVRALTVCCLEMHDVMIGQVYHVLLQLSKIAATVAMAIPLMEFLSGLIRLPHLYASFTEEQYLTLYAIALPYTNPFKYSHYTVSLAYHVIAMWFLKCKLSARRKFVKYIIKALRANVLRPIDESVAQSQRARENEDSSERSRVRSLNDETVRAKAQAAAATKKLEQVKPDDKVMQFHKELMETCIDMMSRFAFSTCATMPKRSHVADFLLEGGQEQSWLIGTKIVTITTSGGARVGSTGLCDKCLQFARRATEKVNNPAPEAAATGRKRHRTEAVRSRSETVVSMKPSSQDDILLHQRTGALREEQSEPSLLTQSSAAAIGTLSGSPHPLEDSTSSQDQSLGSASKEHKLQLVDNVLMGLTAKPTDKSVFSPQQVHCNCWCTLWAEIHIRRPTGNLSWMFRLQNEQDLAEAFPQIMADISNLFMTSPEDDILEYRERRKIDSMTLGESEYDTLLEEHFMSDDASLDETKHRNHSGEQVRKKKLSTQVEEEEVDGVLIQLDGGLRKSSSSPDLTASQQEQLLRGRAQSDLQEAYTRSLEIQKEVPKEVPVSPKRSFQRQISAPPSPEKLSDGERSTSESSNLGDEIDGRLSSLSLRGHNRLTRKVSAPPTSNRPLSLDAAGLDLTSVGWSAAGVVKEAQAHGGVSPSFLFLQLYHSHLLGTSNDFRPVLLQNNDVMKRSVKMLDLIYPYETYKIGVLYVGLGQNQDETSILSNCYGSSRYVEFLQGLGHLVQLTDIKPEETFIGGLDVNGNDGKFAYVWHDDFMQTIYHVATLMPQKDSDPKCNQKKLHIGNDYVAIVYNESGEDYRIGTIKGQFNYVNIVIIPLDHGSNAVTVQTRDDISHIIGHTDTKVISDANLAALVRQMAVHANLASEILKRQKTNPGDPYASNWLERLRQIKRIRSKVESEVKSNQQQQQQAQTPTMEDFTDFV